MKTSATNKRVRDLVTAIVAGTLVPRPEFQRRLVWTNKDKCRFIDTVVKGYPFPEIYLADGEVDLETGEGTQVLVDGQQRVTTLNEYFTGAPSLKLEGGMTAYSALGDDEKKAFLNYEVVVRDLGSVSQGEIIEVFRRINSTSYDLNAMEINHAVYKGEFSSSAEAISDHEIFERFRVFSGHDSRRMGDVRFCINLMISILGDYINRDDDFEEYLATYNESFPQKNDVLARLRAAFAYLLDCNLPKESRAWKKVDFLPLVVETDRAAQEGYLPSPSSFAAELEEFYDALEGNVDVTIRDGDEEASTSEYSRAAIQASNDRQNRVRRGKAIRILLRRAKKEQG